MKAPRARTVRTVAGRTIAVAVLIAAVIAGTIVLAVALLPAHRTTGDTTPTVPPTTRALIEDPHPVVHSLDPTTVPAPVRPAPPGAGTRAGSPPAVTWTMSGSCTRSASAFACHVTLSSSDGLQSAGFVAVYPATSGRKGCEAAAPLDHDAASPRGQCSQPLATEVLAVYSVSPFSDAPVLATAHLSWS